MPRKLPYREGSAFAIDLPSGGFALGVAARVAPKGKLVLGYFFGPRVPSPEWDLARLNPRNAILVGHFGDLHLWNGKWSVIGELPDWLPADWPIPLFLKRDPLGVIPDRVVIYDDNDISLMPRWERWQVIPEGLSEDGLMGAGFVELKLERLFEPSTT